MFWRLEFFHKIFFKAFVDTHRSFPLKRQTVVTSIATLKKSHADETSVSCLVLGTESSAIYILDPEAFTIMESMGLASPPAHLSVTGTLITVSGIKLIYQITWWGSQNKTELWSNIF